MATAAERTHERQTVGECWHTPLNTVQTRIGARFRRAEARTRVRQ
jgi:hypothetical protein